MYLSRGLTFLVLILILASGYPLDMLTFSTNVSLIIKSKRVFKLQTYEHYIVIFYRKEKSFKYHIHFNVNTVESL